MLKSNFLDTAVFENMVNIITSNKMPWYAQTGLAEAGDGQVLYTHVLVDEFQKVKSRTNMFNKRCMTRQHEGIALMIVGDLTVFEQRCHRGCELLQTNSSDKRKYDSEILNY